MTGQIFVNENGHLQVDTIELNAGDDITVLVVDGLDNKTKWIDTTVELYEGTYTLAGLWGYRIEGLFANVNAK